MKNLAKFIIWGFVFLLLLVSLDQTLVHLDLKMPAYREVRYFYLDFRSRLIGVASSQAPASIEAVIKENAPLEPGRNEGRGPAFVYADEQGELHFVDTREEIPERFRKQAQKLGP